jgi:hypothetical protein
MFRLILSAILLFGLVGCYDIDKDITCGTLTINAGSDKTVTVNETVVISGTVTKKDGAISEYEWRKGTETLSTLTSFSYVPTDVGNQKLIFIATDEDGCEASDNMTLTVKPVVSSGSDTPSTTNLDGKYSWTNGTLKATLTSFTKTGEWITLGAVYENISDEDIKLHIYSSTHLLDENGAIWDSTEDTAGLYRAYSSRTILPSRKITTEIKFKAKKSQNGTKFDLILDASPSEFDHRILGIVVN